MFLGSVIIGGGLAAGLYFSLIAMPTGAEINLSQQSVDAMPPVTAWHIWQYYKDGMPATQKELPPILQNLVRQRTSRSGMSTSLGS